MRGWKKEIRPGGDNYLAPFCQVTIRKWATREEQRVRTGEETCLGQMRVFVGGQAQIITAVALSSIKKNLTKVEHTLLLAVQDSSIGDIVSQ